MAVLIALLVSVFGWLREPGGAEAALSTTKTFTAQTADGVTAEVLDLEALGIEGDRFTAQLVVTGGAAAFAQSGTSVIFAQLFTGQSSTGRSKVFVDARNQGITNHVVQWSVSGSPTTCTLLIEKSEDAVSWSTVSTETCTANGSKTLPDDSYIYLTANLSALSGGTSPTVSATYRGYLPGQGIPVRVSEGGTGTTLAFTQGSLVFAGTGGTHAQDNSNFYIDDVNNRLCVGTSGATNCTQTLAIGAGKFLVTSAGLATIKGGAVVNTDGGGLTRAQLIEITDAATTKGLQIEAYAAQTANTFEVLQNGGTVVRTQISKDGAIGSAIDTATVSGTTQIDGNKSNNHKITLTQDTTLSVVTTGMLSGQHVRLLICQDGTAGWKLTWPGTFKDSFLTNSIAASTCRFGEWLWDGTNFYGFHNQTARHIQIMYADDANGDLATQAVFLANRAYKVVAIREVHSALGTDGGAVTLSATKDTGTSAPGAGTGLLTATFDLKAAINTVQAGSLSATEADLILAAGDRLSVVYGGTLTAVAGVVVTFELEVL